MLISPINSDQNPRETCLLQPQRTYNNTITTVNNNNDCFRTQQNKCCCCYVEESIKNRLKPKKQQKQKQTQGYEQKFHVLEQVQPSVLRSGYSVFHVLHCISHISQNGSTSKQKKSMSMIFWELFHALIIPKFRITPDILEAMSGMHHKA